MYYPPGVGDGCGVSEGCGVSVGRRVEVGCKVVGIGPGGEVGGGVEVAPSGDVGCGVVLGPCVPVGRGVEEGLLPSGLLFSWHFRHVALLKFWVWQSRQVAP